MITDPDDEKSAESQRPESRSDDSPDSSIVARNGARFADSIELPQNVVSAGEAAPLRTRSTARLRHRLTDLREWLVRFSSTRLPTRLGPRSRREPALASGGPSNWHEPEPYFSDKFRENLPGLLSKILPFAALALLAYCLVDLGILLWRDRLLPEYPSRAQLATRRPASTFATADYSVLIDRNIFNSDGVIPNEKGGQGDEFDLDKAVPTTLAIELLATIISSDPAQSLAVLKIPSGPAPQTFQQENEMTGVGRMVTIRRGRAYFYVNSSRRLEYAEIPTDVALPRGEFSSSIAGINQASPRDFNVDKKVIEEKTKDLGSLLQQARAVPHLGPNGQIDGFEVEHIQKGSVFESFGIRGGDIIRRVNGQRVDSPARAMELYQALKSESSINLEVERNGKTESLNYTVK